MANTCLIFLLASVCIHCLGAPVDAEAERKAARKAEERQDWTAALRHYENIYDSTPTDDATRAELRLKFAELRPKTPPNADAEKAGVWKVRAFAFRELDFKWKDKQSREHQARFRYRDEELERLRRGMAAFADRVWAYTHGQLRIQWKFEVLEQPLTRLDGDESFWPGPDACMPHVEGFKAGEIDTIMVFVKPFGDPAKGDPAGEVPQMLLGGALGSLGDLTLGATYIGFNWGSGTAANEPDGEPMVHEWLHSVQWALDDFQGYPRGLMASSDTGRMEGEPGGDPCYRRRQDETTWMRFYQHIMRDHVTARMWRELSVTRPAVNAWTRR